MQNSLGKMIGINKIFRNIKQIFDKMRQKTFFTQFVMLKFKDKWVHI